MTCDMGINIHNFSYSPDEELLIYEHSGREEDIPLGIRFAVFQDEQSINQWDAGDWFTVVDGREVSGPNGTHPFSVRAENNGK